MTMNCQLQQSYTHEVEHIRPHIVRVLKNPQVRGDIHHTGNGQRANRLSKIQNYISTNSRLGIVLNCLFTKFPKDWVKLQHNRIKHDGTHGKVLSQEPVILIIKIIALALAVAVVKLLIRVKFSKRWQNSKVKVNGSKLPIPTERHWH